MRKFCKFVFLLSGILCATVENLALFHIIDEENNVTIPFYRIARDGIVANTTKLDYIVLGGAQRLEILFRIDKPGNFFIFPKLFLHVVSCLIQIERYVYFFQKNIRLFHMI